MNLIIVAPKFKMLKFFLAFLIFFCINSFGQKAKKLKRKELKLIEEKLPYEPFEVLTIENKKDSVFLRKQSKKVNLDKNKNEAIYFSKRLLKTVQDPKNMGVGIAAPQVGVQRQIILVQRFDKANEPFEIYINPIIKSCSDEQKLGKEGCLSIPNYTAEVFRPIKIVVEYVDLDGKKHIEEISGFTSVIFQHEIDHLNGILFTDHLQSE